MVCNMKTLTTLALVLFALPFAAQDGKKIRVACVGDSITYGAAVKDRKTNCYPMVLGRLLGDGYEVRNFGVNGATLLKKGDKPYWNLGAFKKATAFAPHFVGSSFAISRICPASRKSGWHFPSRSSRTVGGSTGRRSWSSSR